VRGVLGRNVRPLAVLEFNTVYETVTDPDHLGRRSTVLGTMLNLKTVTENRARSKRVRAPFVE